MGGVDDETVGRFLQAGTFLPAAGAAAAAAAAGGGGAEPKGLIQAPLIGQAAIVAARLVAAVAVSSIC